MFRDKNKQTISVILYAGYPGSECLCSLGNIRRSVMGMEANVSKGNVR